MDWYSQAGQDQWVVATYPEGFTGFFVEVGAYDGVQTSNSYALEQLGWDGLCIEAHPLIAEQCARNRSCRTIGMAAASKRGLVRFEGDRVTSDGGGIEIGCDTLTAMLDQVEAPPLLDYVSIDVEGSELDVLAGFDFDRYTIGLLSIEHNLYCDGPARKDALFEVLTTRGFERVYEDVPCLDPNPMYHLKPYEDWYFGPNLVLPA